MILEMKKFGNILNSRPAGREAVLRVKQIVNGSKEDIILDFAEVEILTPSYADEFVTGIKKLYPDKKITIKGFVDNQVIKETLTALNFL